MAIFSRKEAPLVVSIPSPKEDRALSGKVGIVAIAGFALGIAWPRLLNYQVGPDTPGGGAGVTPPHATSAKSGAASASGAAEPAEASSAGDAENPEDASSPTNRQTVVVADGKVDGCKSKSGGKVEDCGKVSFDKIAKARLAELSRCPAAIGLEGKMSLQVRLDFERNEVVVEGEKKKSGLPSETIRGVLVCAGKELKGVELEKIPHTHLKYSLIYDLAFYPPGKAPASAGSSGGASEEPAEDAAANRATVTYERAIVRETPEKGKIVTRLAQGTRVKILEEKDGWYKIETRKGTGWVYRQAIGR